MNYVFTQAEQQELLAARALCSGDDQTPITTGNWVPLYTKLSDILTRHINAGDVNGEDLQNFKSAKLWLDVAIGANGGTGMHSAFIHSYTNRQGQLRLGRDFSEAEMQKASNGVALNLWSDVSGLNQRLGYTPWTVPSIRQIAEADASSIGINLFKNLLPQGDDAIDFNAGWSGALGFNLLGGANPFESWRLLVDTERNDSSNPEIARNTASLNTLDDFKNILYAVDAYERALKAGYAQGGTDFLLSLGYASAGLVAGQTGSVVPNPVAAIVAQLSIQFASGNIFGFVKDVAAKSPAISPVVNLIANISAPRLLDMLMGAVQGKSLLGTTTDANFASTAKTFFGALSPAQLQAIDAVLLPSSESAISSLAQQTTPEGASARAALLAGSFIRTSISAEVANSEALKLYDPANKTGTLTEQWINDRSLFVLTLGTGQPDVGGQQWRSPHLPRDRSFEFQYVDSSGISKTILAENTARPGGTTSSGLVPSQLIAFGGAGNDTLDGSPNKLGDRLYGGSGTDTLDGKSGADYLEGGVGDDILRGGDNDQASDTLVGGKGIDSYQFTGLFGNDTITDSDGLGNITINGAEIGSLTQVQDNVWENASKTLVLTQVTAAGASAATGGQPVTNLIIGQRTAAGSGSINATITVNGWKDGNLGINLGTQSKKIDTNAFVIAGRTGDQGQNIPEAAFFGQSQYWVRNGAGAGAAISVDAGAGNDLVGGNTEAETISGGAGHDVIAGGGGKDILLGGDGYDWIVADVRATPNGGLDQNGQLTEPPAGYTNADIRTAAQLNIDTDQQGYGWAFYRKADGKTNLPTELIQSGDTSDVYINGGNGTDNLFGSAGNDILDGGADNFNDVLSGGYGNDLLLGGAGQDILNGDQGYFTKADQIDYSRHGKDRLYGGAGDDQMFGGGQDDLLIGDAGKDVLDGDGLGYGGGGGTTPANFHGKDKLDGGAGDDQLLGGGADDVLLGGEGNDRLEGDGSYYLSGSQHSATGNYGEDEIDGGAGDDIITGEGNDDIILGGSGDDVIFGDRGLGDEVKTADHGDDEIEGGAGQDILKGGKGSDTFVFDAADAGGETITAANGAQSYNASFITIEDTEGSNTLRIKNTTKANIKTQVFEDAPNDVYLVMGGELTKVNGQLQITPGASFTKIKDGELLNDGFVTASTASATYLDINSKLLRIYAGDIQISVLKQPKSTCKITRNSRRTSIFRTKQADRRRISSIVCYRSRSKLRLRVKFSELASLRTRRGATTMQGVA